MDAPSLEKFKARIEQSEGFEQPGVQEVSPPIEGRLEQDYIKGSF